MTPTSAHRVPEAGRHPMSVHIWLNQRARCPSRLQYQLAHVLRSIASRRAQSCSLAGEAAPPSPIWPLRLRVETSWPRLGGYIWTPHRRLGGHRMGNYGGWGDGGDGAKPSAPSPPSQPSPPSPPLFGRGSRQTGVPVRHSQRMLTDPRAPHPVRAAR